MLLKKIFLGISLSCILASCAVIRQDEVGVRRRFGKITSGILPAGLHGVNPFTSSILILPIRTLNMPVQLEALPSKEGLSIVAELSILYRIRGEQAIQIFKEVGSIRSGEQIITSVLRSAAADVTAKFFAKDMHTIQRENIEKDIAIKMTEILGNRGFVIENVLLKSIRLPAGLSESIESKLQAEQDSQRMEFILSKEKQEAERKRVEAAGIRDAQKIIAEGLTPILIQYKSLEVMLKLSLSPNTKIIITDGKAPYLINPSTDK